MVMLDYALPDFQSQRVGLVSLLHVVILGLVLDKLYPGDVLQVHQEGMECVGWHLVIWTLW